MSHHIIALLAVTLFVVGCAAQTRPPNRTANALHTQLDDDWKYWMTQYPEMATAFGYPGQNMRWTDYSQPAIDARADYLRRSFDRLKGINRAELDSEAQIDYDLYRELLETAVKGLEFHNDASPIKGVVPHNLLMPVNQMEGVQQDIPRTIAMMPSTIELAASRRSPAVPSSAVSSSTSCWNCRAVPTTEMANCISTGRFIPERSGSTRARTLVRLLARARAPACGWYPRAWMLASTRCRVVAEMARLPLST